MFSMSEQRGKLVLSSAEKEQLRQLIRAQKTPQGLAQRARVVELAAQGMGVRAIGEKVGLHYNQVAKWRRRYIRGGLGALQDEPRSGRKGNLSTGGLAPHRRSGHATTAGLGPMDLPLDGSRVGSLHGDRAAGREGERNQAAPDAGF